MSLRRTPPRFDRDDPLGRRTLHDIAVTGAGQASPGRLRMTLGCSALVAVALIVTHHRFLLPLPLALGGFSGYGLALQAAHRLDVRQEAALLRRRLLTAAAALSVATASLSLLVGVALLVARGLGWDWRAALR